MTTRLSAKIVVTAEGDEVSSPDVQEGKHHRLHAQCDHDNGNIVLNFSTRRAMYDFAVSLLQESVYGTSGQQEFYPLGYEGDWLVVNGVRMAEHSARVMVSYGSESSEVDAS